MRRTAALMVLLVLVVAAAIVMGVAGVPMVPVVVAAAGVGGALVAWHMAASRMAGAVEADPDIEWARLRVPVERVAVGRAIQMRLLPPTRSVWAPGVLAVDRGHVRFVPSRRSRGHLGWEATVQRIELMRVGPRASAVRLHAEDGTAAQFVAQMSELDLRLTLEPHLSLDPA